jgi:hypothetical protein
MRYGSAAVRPLLPLLLVILSGVACGASVQQLADDGPDAKSMRRRATRLLADPAQRPSGYLTRVWLCLLHDEDCDHLHEFSRQSGPSDEAVLLRALVSSGQAGVAPQARAWREALRLPGAHLTTLAAQSLASLAMADRQAVVAELAAAPSEVAAALETGPPLARWHRWTALAPLLQVAPPTPGWRAPFVLWLQRRPWSQRLHTGLERVTPVELAAAPTPELSVPPLADAAALPPAWRPGSYALPTPVPGVYRLRLARPSTERALLIVQAARGAQVSTGDRWLLRTAPREVGMTWLDATECEIVVAAAGGDPALRIDLLQVPARVPAEPEAHRGPDAAVQPGSHCSGGLLGDLTATLAGDAKARQRLLGQGLGGPLLLLADLALRAAGAAPDDVLDQTLHRWPLHVEALLARVSEVREAGNPGLALQLLRPLGPLVPDPAGTRSSAVPPADRRGDLWLERAEVLLANGLADEAARATRAAVEAQPRDCRVHAAALRIGIDGPDRALLRWLLPRRPDCPAHALTLAAAQATVGDTPAATSTLLSALVVPAMASSAARQLTRQAEQMGEPAPGLPAWASDTEEAGWSAVQDAALATRATRFHAALTQAVEGRDVPLEVRRKALLAGARAPWAAFVRSGEALARQPDEPALVDGAATAWLLDQEIVLLLPGGGAIRRVHQMVRVLQDEAAEQVGEVRVGDGADLEFARTLTADGVPVLPAETADKSTVSLRALERGAAAEYAQVAWQAPDDPATGATRLPSFTLQATDAPCVLSEYVVLVPDGLQVQFDSSANVPAPTKRQLAGFTAHVWRNAAVPRANLEPRSGRADRILPTVRVRASDSLQATLEPWAEALAAGAAATDRDLERWVAEARALAPGRGRWQALMPRLAQQIEHDHEDGPPGRPSTALRHQRGDRAALLYAIAKRAGDETCLIRVAPLSRLPVPSPADPDDWPIELVRIRSHNDEVWYDPGLEGGLLDHLRPALRGREGLAVGCTVAEPRLVVPALGEGKDRRQIRLRLHWSATGGLEGDVVEILHGGLAGVVRRWAAQANEQTRAELVRQLGGQALANCALDWQEARGLDAPTDTPLTLRYRVTGKPGAVLDLALFPEALGQAYGSLPDRRTPLLFAASIDAELEVELSSDLPLAPRAWPDVAIAHRWLEYRRQVRVEGNVLRISRVLRSRPALIEPADYPQFGGHVRAIDAADVLRIER